MRLGFAFSPDGSGTRPRAHAGIHPKGVTRLLARQPNKRDERQMASTWRRLKIGWHGSRVEASATMICPQTQRTQRFSPRSSGRYPPRTLSRLQLLAPDKEEVPGSSPGSPTRESLVVPGSYKRSSRFSSLSTATAARSSAATSSADHTLPSLYGRNLFGDNCQPEIESVVLRPGHAHGLSTTRLDVHATACCSRSRLLLGIT
jgi:hypothetical protein